MPLKLATETARAAPAMASSTSPSRRTYDEVDEADGDADDGWP